MADGNYAPSVPPQPPHTEVHGGGTALTGPGIDVPVWAGVSGVLVLAAIASLIASRIRQRRATS